eukprot:1392002-Amorphochlora_amoeboformis.AAC.3
MEAGGKRPSWRGFLDGGLASCGAEVATMPLDVLKMIGIRHPSSKLSYPDRHVSLRLGESRALSRSLQPWLTTLILHQPCIFAKYSEVDGQKSSTMENVHPNSSKVRMQLQGQPGFLAANPITTAATMLREEGIFVFWRGTSPAILRQATYGTLRIGLYSRAKAYIGIEEGSAKADPLRKMSAGVISGSAAAAICNPTDLIKPSRRTLTV